MATTSALEAIAFDLDGTLVDSAPDIQRALNSALGKAGLQHFDVETVRAWIGDGPDALIQRALDQQGIAGADDIELRRYLRRGFDVATLAAPLAYGTVYPGIAELLRSLHGRLPLVVVTNKPTALAQAVLGAAELLRHVARVHGADEAVDRKPAPALLSKAARALGVAPARLLMVGDGPTDLLAARAAGCPAALVAWGYGAHTVPPGLEPWRIATPQQLLAGITQRLQQQREELNL